MSQKTSKSYKTYLTERKESSEIILNNMATQRLPISPKVWEEVFGTQELYCFVAMEDKRLPSLVRRQHKRNQISTFTDWKDTDIFWGADGLDWYTDQTIVAVVKGKSTLSSHTDLWTTKDPLGRRWIDASDYRDNNNNALALTLDRIQREITDEYVKSMEKLNHPNIKIRSNHVFLVYEEPISQKDENHLKKEMIKTYFDSTKKILRRNRKKLKRARLEAIEWGYNEVLCYDYEIVEILVYDPSSDGNIYDYSKIIMRKYPEIFKKYDYRVFTELKAMETAMRKYQKKNKDLK